MMQVKVLFFGAAADIAGHSETEFSLPENTKAAQAFEKILETHAPLRSRFGNSLLFAVNQEYANHNQEINNDDELAIFPPVSGG
jgi:molybdopterin synthase sulfur carrier subunit